MHWSNHTTQKANVSINIDKEEREDVEEEGLYIEENIDDNPTSIIVSIKINKSEWIEDNAN